MHSSMGSHTSFFPKELKCTHGPFRLDLIKEKAIWPHLSGGVFAGEEGHYQLAAGCGPQLLSGAVQRSQDA